MFKIEKNSFTSVDSCSRCVRQKDCLMPNLKKHLPSLSTIHAQVFRVNDSLFRVGDKLESLYIVKSGSIKTFITTQAGEEQILNFYGPGDVVGLDGLPFNQHMSTALSLETSSACIIPIAKLEEAFEQLIPPWLFEFAMNKLKQQSENIYLQGKKNAHNRIAAFLLKLSENNKIRGCSDTEFDLSMSRDDIGNYLGLASETVSRTLTHMRKNGYVKLNRRHVTIVDSQCLHTLAKN